MLLDGVELLGLEAADLGERVYVELGHDACGDIGSDAVEGLECALLGGD